MELITIKKSEGGKSVVSARELYEQLGLGKDQFSRWAKKNITDNAFAAFGEDWAAADIMSGGRKYEDFVLTIDFAKRLSMMAKTVQGEDVRRYFIECEKKLIEVVAAPKLPTNYIEALEALVVAEKEKEVIQLQLEEAKPKVEFYDAVTDSTDAVDLGTAAKVLNLGFGRTTLFEKLRDNKILMKNNQPFQKYIDAGWFRVIETSWTHPNGDTHVNFKTVVYQKGLDGIRKVLSTENF